VAWDGLLCQHFLVDSFPDLGDLGDKELKELLGRLVAEERGVLTTELETSSYERRILHGKIDIVRAGLVYRTRRPVEATIAPTLLMEPEPGSRRAPQSGGV
jgi:RsiG-like